MSKLNEFYEFLIQNKTVKSKREFALLVFKNGFTVSKYNYLSRVLAGKHPPSEKLLNTVESSFNLAKGFLSVEEASLTKATLLQELRILHARLGFILDKYKE